MNRAQNVGRNTTKSITCCTIGGVMKSSTPSTASRNSAYSRTTAETRRLSPPRRCSSSTTGRRISARIPATASGQSTCEKYPTSRETTQNAKTSSAAIASSANNARANPTTLRWRSVRRRAAGSTRSLVMRRQHNVRVQRWPAERRGGRDMQAGREARVASGHAQRVHAAVPEAQQLAVMTYEQLRDGRNSVSRGGEGFASIPAHQAQLRLSREHDGAVIQFDAGQDQRVGSRFDPGPG